MSHEKRFLSISSPAVHKSTPCVNMRPRAAWKRSASSMQQCVYRRSAVGIQTGVESGGGLSLVVSVALVFDR